MGRFGICRTCHRTTWGQPPRLSGGAQLRPGLVCRQKGGRALLDWDSRGRLSSAWFVADKSILSWRGSVADSLGTFIQTYVRFDRGGRHKIRLRGRDRAGRSEDDAVSDDLARGHSWRSPLSSCAQESAGELKAVGIGSFGPIDLHSTSLTFGYVTSTPKAGWQNYNLAGTVRDALGVPVGFDTDVSAAALGEARWGAAQNLTDFLYLTIGTGIGGGAIINGRVLHGLVHPEMGHIQVPHDLVEGPISGRLPLPRRLPGRIGFWSGDAGALGQGRPGPSAGPSGMDFGSALSRAGSGQLGADFVTAAHSAGRRRVAPVASFRSNPARPGGTAQRICPGNRGDTGHRPVCGPTATRRRAGVLGGLVLAEQAYSRLDGG